MNFFQFMLYLDFAFATEIYRNVRRESIEVVDDVMKLSTSKERVSFAWHLGTCVKETEHNGNVKI